MNDTAEHRRLIEAVPEAMLEALGADVRLVHVHQRPDLPGLPGNVKHRPLVDGDAERFVPDVPAGPACSSM